MSLKKRIRDLLDAGTGNNVDLVVKTIVAEGVSDDELREILPEIVSGIAKMRAPKPFLSKPDRTFSLSKVDIHSPNAVHSAALPVRTATSSAQSAALLPKAEPVLFKGSSKVAGYRANRLDELYPVGGGQHKKLSEMNREDIRFNVRMLQGKVKAYEGRITGWEKILYQMESYKVNVVDELPVSVKNAI